MKDFRISPSLREKCVDLLTKYEPSDIAYTIVGALYDRYNKVLLSKPHDPKHSEELMNRKNYYPKAWKRFLALSKALKLVEMQYLKTRK